MQLSNFDYFLPEKLIAQSALNPRDLSKLLVLTNSNSLIEKRFYDLVDFLERGDVLVLNKTKVSKVKLIGKKITGSAAEIILLKKIQTKVYLCKIKTKNPIIGTKIIFPLGDCEIIDKKSIDEFIVKFSSSKILSSAILPQPPYINRLVKNSEYQTVFSKDPGSLAAPTAGLHFTKKLLKKISEKGVKIVFITLHVSYGTFKNIDSNISNFKMDPEYFEISKEVAKIINSRKGRLFAVGTTVLKTLESSSKNGVIYSGSGYSKIFIHPPFKFNSGVDALITNFHLPKSTLILLTCAFGGTKRILNAYHFAIKNNYRFYSLGDSMLVFRGKNL